MSPVCFACRIEMRPEQNDFIVEEMAERDRPYRVWSTDLYRCPGCGAKVICGFAREPMAEHWAERYALQAAHAQLRYWPRREMRPPAVVSATEAPWHDPDWWCECGFRNKAIRKRCRNFDCGKPRPLTDQLAQEAR